MELPRAAGVPGRNASTDFLPMARASRARLPPQLGIGEPSPSQGSSVFHGSPRSDIEALLATTPERQLHPAFESAPDAQVFAGGHAHVQLLRMFRDRVLLNPGNVGPPLGSVAAAFACGIPLPTRAEYAVMRAGDSGLEVSFLRVPIDVGAVAAATAAMPHASWADDLERRIARWNARAAHDRWLSASDDIHLRPDR